VGHGTPVHCRPIPNRTSTVDLHIDLHRPTWSNGYFINLGLQGTASDNPGDLAQPPAYLLHRSSPAYFVHLAFYQYVTYSLSERTLALKIGNRSPQVYIRCAVLPCRRRINNATVL